MKKSLLRAGGQWLFVLLLLASRSAGPGYAQSPSDATFLATLGELRDATFDDKDKIVERLARAVIRMPGCPHGVLEDRLYFRNDDQKFPRKSALLKDRLYSVTRIRRFSSSNRAKRIRPRSI